MSASLLATRIREQRRRRGLTVAALALAAGLSKGFISQLEAGKSQPSIETLTRIASALGVAASELLDVTGPERSGSQASTHAAVIRHESYRGDLPFVQLSERERASTFLVMLPALGSLAGERANGPVETGRALGIVLGGTIELVEGGSSFSLGQSDIASWDATQPYLIRNAGFDVVSLAMILPQGVALPSIVTDFVRDTMPQVEKPFVTSVEGPLRLVAMRSERLAARRRQ